MANLQHAEDETKHVDVPGEAPAALPTPPPAAESAAPGLTVSVIPSFAAAMEMLSSPYSCLVMVAHRRHIALPPVYLRKKRTGIQEELEAELLRFSQRMNGVPLAYDGIKILGGQGDIHDDSGYIHMNVEANFIVFKPTESQKLLGKVNKLGVNHVGCLVHGCFNASIPKPNLIPVETWKIVGPKIGEDIEFQVMALDADTAGVLLIRGRLERTRVQELLARSESTQSSVMDNHTERQEVDPKSEPGQDSLDDNPKKEKKKKKKNKEKDEKMDISITGFEMEGSVAPVENGTDEVDSLEPGERKKKKRKKEKRAEEEETKIHGSDSSGYISDKPSKKRKHQSDYDVTTSFSEDTEPTKSKKKKKKADIEQFA